ncbi:carotenoid 9,10(9',10')-cleavage dioxygenase-like [Magnolia sinica]|uniref:carotenoid 9,10(9',10')-cleavage dioxygenase-like n=1 Tax=Magnolia sinica TaxID=86752 RepID=UPI00265A1CAB|nr:carotenoid 9,10(9',10')-cleavage dioxygenase-like [Magnolia sinica]
MKTGVASQKQLSASAVDFPQINESYTGRRLLEKKLDTQGPINFNFYTSSTGLLDEQAFVYGTIFLDNITKVQGIIKFDLHAEPEVGKSKLQVGGNIPGIFKLGAGRFGLEAIFVPRKPGLTSEENDVYLIFFRHDENTG